MPRGSFSINERAQKGLSDNAKKLMAEEGMSETDAYRVSASEMDGAGEGVTVESVQTCRDLDGCRVPGLSTDDSVTGRKDKFAKTEEEREVAASTDDDEAGKWLREHDNEYRGKSRGWRA